MLKKHSYNNRIGVLFKCIHLMNTVKYWHFTCNNFDFFSGFFKCLCISIFSYQKQIQIEVFQYYIWSHCYFWISRFVVLFCNITLFKMLSIEPNQMFSILPMYLWTECIDHCNELFCDIETIIKKTCIVWCAQPRNTKYSFKQRCTSTSWVNRDVPVR